MRAVKTTLLSLAAIGPLAVAVFGIRAVSKRAGSSASGERKQVQFNAPAQI